ncbi:MAG: tetratricopeptide repeat protein [Nitrospiraceae bacterium]|jgi:tetratricopeptide (TPR) repeat protein|nr:tetratricopeptide repeat protein [Nitrospiraceae bacterium]
MEENKGIGELFDEAETFRLTGKLIDAIALYRQILIRIPNAPMVLRRLAECLIEKGVPQEAITALEDAIRLDPDEPSQYHTLAGALRGRGRMNDALLIYRKAVDRSPDNITYLVDLAWCMADIGAMGKDRTIQENALEVLTKAHGINDRDPGIWDGLAGIYKDLGDRAKAIECVRKALELDPYDTDRIELLERLSTQKAPNI